MNSFEKKHVYFLLKELPFILYFQIPELAAFKYFIWKRFFSGFQDEGRVQFSFNYPRFDEHYAIGLKILDIYNKIPTTEIWNSEAIITTLQQIKYYYEAGGIVSKEQAFILFDKVEQLVNHIEKEATAGVKFKIGEQPNSGSAEYRLFNNELVFGDNTFLAELGNTRITFLNHSFMQFIATRDIAFNDAMLTYMNNLMKKSKLISSIDERERLHFFNLLRQEIYDKKAKLV